MDHSINEIARRAYAELVAEAQRERFAMQIRRTKPAARPRRRTPISPLAGPLQTVRPLAGPAVLTAVALSVALAGAAMVDQVGLHTLIDHARASYASLGKEPPAGLLYGVVYGVAGADALLWLLVLRVLRVARAYPRPAAILAGLVAATSAGLGALLLTSADRTTPIFPPLWGVLALLPAAAGILAVAFLLRRCVRRATKTDVVHPFRRTGVGGLASMVRRVGGSVSGRGRAEQGPPCPRGADRSAVAR